MYVLTDPGPVQDKVMTADVGYQPWYRISLGNFIPVFNYIYPNVSDQSLFPRTGNIAGPGQFTETDYDNLGLTLQQQVGKNLFLRAVVNHQYDDMLFHQVVGFGSDAVAIDATSTLPTFAPDGSFNGTHAGDNRLIFNSVVPNPYAGKMIVASNPTNVGNNQTRDDYRLDGSYHLDLGRLGDHNLSAFLSRSDQLGDTFTDAEVNVSPQREDLTNQFGDFNLVQRVTHIDPFSASLSERGMPDPALTPIPSGPIYGTPGYSFVDGWRRETWNKTKQIIDSAAIAMQSSFFDGSLITTLGARRDIMNSYSSTASYSVDYIATAANLNGTPDVDVAGNTYTLGAVYRLPRLKQVGLYVNKSTSFQSQNAAYYFGDLAQQKLIGPLESQGVDFGFKWDLFGGRTYVDLGRFEVQQTDQAGGINGALPFYADAIWDAIELNGATIHAPGGQNTQASRSSGYELEIVSNPTNNWRISFNLSKAENVTSGLGNAFRGYYNANLSTWQAHGSVPIDTTKYGEIGGNNTVADAITLLQTYMAQDAAGNGLSGIASRAWNSNLFTAYSFTKGPLKNLTIGFGANYRGPEVLGYDNTDPTHIIQVTGSSYVLATGMVSYSMKLSSKVDMKLQLNVSNLFNNQNLQIVASSFAGAMSANERTYFFNPRSFTLTARFMY